MENLLNKLKYLHNRDVCLLFTPGLDSFLSDWFINNFCFLNENMDSDYKNHILKYHDSPILKSVKRIYFDNHSPYSELELNKLLKIYHSNNKEKYFYYHNSINTSSIEKKGGYVPNRNLLFLSMAQSLTDANTLIISGFKDDRVSDNNEQFYNAATKALSISCGSNVTVLSLFSKYEKADILKPYLEINNNDINSVCSLPHKTFSCYSPLKREECRSVYHVDEQTLKLITPIYTAECLKCKACLRKYTALLSVGVYVPFRDKELMKSVFNTLDRKLYPKRYDTLLDYINADSQFK